jgi:hypothetical protein
MSALQESTSLKTVAFAAAIVEVGATNPALTSIKDDTTAHVLRSATRYTTENFQRIYLSNPGANSTNSGSQTVTSSIPPGFSESDCQSALQLQAEIDVHLGLSVHRIGTIIGQKVQVDILSMLDQVEGTLRSAFQLDLVQDSVRKRSRALFETKSERVKRAKLMEREKSLSEIE